MIVVGVGRPVAEIAGTRRTRTHEPLGSGIGLGIVINKVAVGSRRAARVDTLAGDRGRERPGLHAGGHPGKVLVVPVRIFVVLEVKPEVQGHDHPGGIRPELGVHSEVHHDEVGLDRHRMVDRETLEYRVQVHDSGRADVPIEVRPGRTAGKDVLGQRSELEIDERDDVRDHLGVGKNRVVAVGAELRTRPGGVDVGSITTCGLTRGVGGISLNVGGITCRALGSTTGQCGFRRLARGTALPIPIPYIRSPVLCSRITIRTRNQDILHSHVHVEAEKVKPYVPQVGMLVHPAGVVVVTHETPDGE